MLKMTDVKSNDFAYFDSIENTQTRSSVKNAFRYIINLSNLSGTTIDHWDIESVFKHEDKWLTDKGEINREFFKRKDAEPAAILNLPERLVKMLEVPLKEIHGQNLREIKNSIQTRERNITNAQSTIGNNVRELRILRERILIAEIATKESMNTVSLQLRKTLTALPLELWSVSGDTVAFICNTDTMVNARDLPNEINRTFNLGRLIFWVNVVDLNIKVTRQDIINRWVSASNAHFHYGSYLCQGGFSPDFEEAAKKVDLYALLSACMKWKDTYDARSTLVSSSRFNHHPAFTTYHDGDWMFGLDEKAQCEGAWKAGVHYTLPMFGPIATAIKLSVTTVRSPWTAEYTFETAGGPTPGRIYEHAKPLDKQLQNNSNEDALIEFTEENLISWSFEEYIAWLYDHIEISDYDHGDEGPDRHGYERHLVYANREEGEWQADDQWDEWNRNNGDGE